MAIQKGKALKKVGDKPKETARRNTIAEPQPTKGGDDDGDLMSQLKKRMSLRRMGISGARKAEDDAGATGDKPKPSPMDKAVSMPAMLKSGELPESPISMAGMASALKAAASNRPESDDDEDNWDDD